MMTRRLTGAAFLIALTMTAAACATSATGDNTESGEVVIGLVAPSSGFAANYGPEAAHGF